MFCLPRVLRCTLLSMVNCQDENKNISRDYSFISEIVHFASFILSHTNARFQVHVSIGGPGTCGMTVIGRREDGHVSTVFAHPLRDATNAVMAMRDDGVLHVLNMATGGAAHVLCVTPIRLKIAKGQLLSHLYGGICVWVGIISECVSVISELICCVIIRSQSTRMLTRSRTRSVGWVWGYVVLWFRHSAIKGIVVNLPSFGAHVEMNIDSPLTTSLFVFPTLTTTGESNSVDVHGTSSHTTLAGVIRSVHIGMPPSFNNPPTPLEYIGHRIVVVNISSVATNATMLNVSLDSGVSPNTAPSGWGLGVVNRCVRAAPSCC